MKRDISLYTAGPEAPTVSAERLLGLTFGIPMPPGQTLFPAVQVKAGFYSSKPFRGATRLHGETRKRDEIRDLVVREMRRVVKRKTLGPIDGVLDDETVTSAGIAHALELPLRSPDDLQHARSTSRNEALRDAKRRPRTLDLRRLHDLLMAMHPEVLQVVAGHDDPPSWDNYFLLEQRRRIQAAAEARTENHRNGDPPLTDRTVSVPVLCTRTALDEIRALNVESEVKWGELLTPYPREYRRNIWIIFSPERVPAHDSSLVCPLTDPRFAGTASTIKPAEKIAFQDGVTLNGVFNDWPNNNGRLTETIQTLGRDQLADEFRRRPDQILAPVEKGLLAQAGYLDLKKIRELITEPHLVTRYANTLNRLSKAEKWVINLNDQQKQQPASDWSSWLQEVGFWPTFEVKNS